MFKFMFNTDDLEYQGDRRAYLKILYIILLVFSFIVNIIGPFILGIVLAITLDEAAFLLLWFCIPLGFLAYCFWKMVFVVILGGFYDLTDINVGTRQIYSGMKNLKIDIKETESNIPLVTSKEEKEEVIKKAKKINKSIKVNEEGYFVKSSVVSEVDPTVIPEGTKCIIKSISGNKVEVALSLSGRYIITTVDDDYLKILK